MALTLSGTNGVVGAGFTVDNSGVSVTAGVGTFSSLQGSAASLTSIPAANIVGVCTSGLTKTGGFGKILQIQSANLATSIQITSTSYVTTGVTVNITPTSASSKILIATSFPIYKSGSSAAVDVTLYRDSTNLGDGTYGFGQFGNLGGAGGICGVNLQFSDSPNTTSQVTYAVYGKINSGHNFYVMSNNVDANITAMEYST